MTKTRAIRLCFLTLPLLLCGLLAGCWDYRGLNELTIVTGIAVDLDEEGEGFSLTFEIVDMTKTSEEMYNARLLVTQGNSIAEAVYDANTKLHDNMYLGNAEVVVVSAQVARKQGLHVVMDSLLRDHTTRDSLHIVVAGTDTAQELFDPGSGDKAEDEEEGEGEILSFLLSASLDQHAGNSNSTNAVELYEIYNILHLKTSNLALPIVNQAKEEKEPFQLDGMALFTDDRMTGILSEEDMSYYLLGIKRLHGGGYPVESGGEDGQTLSAVIANRSSSPSNSFHLEDGRLHFVVDVRMSADMISLSTGWGEITGETIRQLEQDAGNSLSASVREVLLDMRDRGYDLLGFQETLRNRDYKLWTEIEQDWSEWFAQSDIQVRVAVHINNTGMIEAYGGGSR